MWRRSRCRTKPSRSSSARCLLPGGTEIRGAEGHARDRGERDEVGQHLRICGDQWSDAELLGNDVADHTAAFVGDDSGSSLVLPEQHIEQGAPISTEREAIEIDHVVQSGGVDVLGPRRFRSRFRTFSPLRRVDHHRRQPGVTKAHAGVEPFTARRSVEHGRAALRGEYVNGAGSHHPADATASMSRVGGDESDPAEGGIGIGDATAGAHHHPIGLLGNEHTVGLHRLEPLDLAEERRCRVGALHDAIHRGCDDRELVVLDDADSDQAGRPCRNASRAALTGSG